MYTKVGPPFFSSTEALGMFIRFSFNNVITFIVNWTQHLFLLTSNVIVFDSNYFSFILFVFPNPKTLFWNIAVISIV